MAATDKGYITLYDTRKLELHDPLAQLDLSALLYNRLKRLIIHRPTISSSISSSTAIQPLSTLFSDGVELSSSYQPNYFSSSNYTVQSIPTPYQLLSTAHKKINSNNESNNNNNASSNSSSSKNNNSTPLQSSLPIQSIALNPNNNHELAFQLANSSCGVIDLLSKRVTQFGYSSSFQGTSAFIFIITTTTIIPSFIRPFTHSYP